MISQVSCSCLAILVLLFPPSIHTFNIDTRHKFLQFSTPHNTSEFGYSVSLIDNPTSPLVVGAPSFDQGVGAIFKCDLRQQKCDVVDVNHGGTPEQREGQKFGFSLTWVGNQLMACAPRFRIFITVKDDDTGKMRPESQPVGKCLMFDRNVRRVTSDNEIPCEEIFNQDKPHNMLLEGFGYCLAGTSSTGLPGREPFQKPTFFLGTPGTRHYTGHPLALLADKDIAVPASGNLDEFPYEFRNSYIGYSVSAGHVIDRQPHGEVMAGAPRGRDLSGFALLYKLEDKFRKDFTWKVDLENPHTQLGSYFGGAVCVCDVNGDGADDVLVGAPYFAKVQDEGRVYVYMNSPADATYNRTHGSGDKYGFVDFFLFLMGLLCD